MRGAEEEVAPTATENNEKATLKLSEPEVRTLQSALRNAGNAGVADPDLIPGLQAKLDEALAASRGD